MNVFLFRWSSITRSALLVMAALAALVPVSPTVVERVYSRGAYPGIQRFLTSIGNLVPLALFDIFVGAVALGWIVALVLDLKRSPAPRQWLGLTGRLALRTLVWSAGTYLLFLSAWGLNYRREALESRLEYERRSVNSTAARGLGAEAVSRLNALYQAAHRAPAVSPHAIDAELSAAFARTMRTIDAGRVVVGRPKTTMFDWYLKRAVVDGMTDPFFLETLVVSGLLPVERPVTVAHEWSHLAGFADEGEANFLGWLTCVHGSAAHQYSAWLFLYQEIMATAARRDRDALAAGLQPGPREDLRAISGRIARSVSPRLASASWRAYDAYLKANGVEAGAASYTEVVRLVLGVQFGADWTPKLSHD